MRNSDHEENKNFIVQLEVIQSPVFNGLSEFSFRSEKKLMHENVMKINKYLEYLYSSMKCVWRIFT